MNESLWLFWRVFAKKDSWRLFRRGCVQCRRVICCFRENVCNEEELLVVSERVAVGHTLLLEELA